MPTALSPGLRTPPALHRHCGVQGYVNDGKGGKVANGAIASAIASMAKAQPQVLPAPLGPPQEVLLARASASLRLGVCCFLFWHLPLVTRLGVFCKEALRPVPLAFLAQPETPSLAQETCLSEAVHFTWP